VRWCASLVGVVDIREVAPDDWQVMRDIRLEALREAPYAFGSTYAREVPFTEEQWRGRISDRAVTYLAYLPGLTEPSGLAGVYIEDGGSAELVSMWVRPAARGRKAGEALIGATASWAAAQGHAALNLWVAGPNHAARRLYERHGFTETGERQPLPSDPDVTEIRMSRPLLGAP
jgi:ribosomal protein S18 acetylase RimI-like enzyme